jgi:hypothetical protein
VLAAYGPASWEANLAEPEIRLFDYGRLSLTLLSNKA